MREELTKKIRLNLQNGGDGKKNILHRQMIRKILHLNKISSTLTIQNYYISLSLLKKNKRNYYFFRTFKKTSVKMNKKYSSIYNSKGKILSLNSTVNVNRLGVGMMILDYWSS